MGIIVVMSTASCSNRQPLELYNKPVNKFVAGFHWQPYPNLIEGSIAANDGTLQFGTIRAISARRGRRA